MWKYSRIRFRTSNKSKDSIKGNIDILDVRFGSLWTNITREDFVSMGFKYGDIIEVLIKKQFHYSIQ